LWLRFKQWLWPCCASAAAVVVFLAAEASQYVAARQRLDELQREHLPLESLDAQVAALRARIDRQTREIEVVRRLEGCRPPLALLGLVGQSARDCQGQLQIESLAFHPVQRAKTADPSGEAARTTGHPSGTPKAGVPPAKPGGKTETKPPAESDGDSALVTIKGVALDNLSVARFVAALRQTKALRRVELKSTKEQPLGACRVCSWMIECGY
jgi:hypothetical protein